MKRTHTQQAWLDDFKPACKRRGVRYVSETGFVVDDVYITELTALFEVRDDDDRDYFRIAWTVAIKALAVDDVLWAAFLPNVEMGRQMRINRRINGTFTISPLRIAQGRRKVVAGDAPDWDPILDQFDRARKEFIAKYPTAVDFASALAQQPDNTASNRALTREVAALIAAERSGEAVKRVDGALARGERGSMASTADVLEYLRAYARGPDAFASFTASLTPTHDFTSASESKPSQPVTVCRERDRINLRHYLGELNGVDPFAVILSARGPNGQPPAVSGLLYLQAAGTADAMTVEFCGPGGAELGAVAVRSVVGRATSAAGESNHEVDIVLPRSVETVNGREVFTADEAADMFERFYRTDVVGEGYVLRAVEGFTAGGSRFGISSAADDPR